MKSGGKLTSLGAIVAIAFPAMALATPQLSIPSFSAQPGKAGELRIEISGGDVPYAGFNAKFKLPKGFTVTAPTLGTLLTAGFEIDSNVTYDASGATVRILAYSTASTWTAPDGVLARIAFDVDSTVVPGSYPIAFSAATSGAVLNAGHAISNADGSKSIAHAVSAATLTVVSASTGPDFDGDGIVDDADPDDDNDGIPDDVELANGLNPKDASDALKDKDGDGVSNLDEFKNGTNISGDSVGPAITAPEDLTVDSTGPLTRVDFGTATANDAVDGKVTPTTDSGDLFEPGQHRVIWTATDKAGNKTTKEQVVTVRPMVEFAANQVVAEDDGPVTVTVTAVLNGDAAAPVSVPFTVSGTATAGSDHNAAKGTLVIDSVTNTGQITFSVLPDATAEDDETIVFTMGTPTNAVAGPNSKHTVTIVADNKAPLVSLVVAQANVPTRLVAANGGTVEISASVSDPNAHDDHTYDWASSDDTLTAARSGPANSAVFKFDPSGLAAGLYHAVVKVTDSGSPAQTTEVSELIRVVAKLPTLAAANDSDNDGLFDDEEGLDDPTMSGVPAYLNALSDGRPLHGRALRLKTDDARWMAEAPAGATLSLGAAAFGARSAVPVVSFDDVKNFGLDARAVTNPDDKLSYTSGVFDVTVRGIGAVGGSVPVVIALLDPIPNPASYRQFLASGWSDWTDDGANKVSSAPGEAGLCPPPGSSEYKAGLADGDHCVQLTIQDGGPNDADGLANGVVHTLGGIATGTAPGAGGNTGGGSSGGGDGGGGVLSLTALMALLFGLMAALRRTSTLRVRTATQSHGCGDAANSNMG